MKFMAAIPAILLATWSGPAVLAQDSEGSGNTTAGELEYIGGLQACQAIVADNARLVCFDQQVSRIVGASEAGEVTIVSAEDMKETRRGLFGLSLPKIKLFGDNGDANEEDEMFTSTITSARQIKRGSWIFQIADGDAVWQINNAPRRLREIERGSTVVFKQASLGTYFIRIDGQMGIKGRRIK